MPPRLAAASRNAALSALIARRAVTEARKVRDRASSVAIVVATHQIANAQTSDIAVTEMLAEQGITTAAEALLNLVTFTTDPATIERMLASVEREAQTLVDQANSQTFMDASFDRLVESLVQESARAAESVAVVTRAHIYHVRMVNPPCCSRCAVLAGRVYSWSLGFLRHPGCDCTMIPTTVASPYRQSPEQLVADGQVAGMSKADLRALAQGADLSKVVNVRLRKAGLSEAGEVLGRAGRPTPAGIYRIAGDDREKALSLLQQYRYLL